MPNPKLLILEDDANIRNAMEHFLMRNGYDVESVTTFSQADAILAATDADLVILDLGLPYNDGLTLLTQFRRARDIPVLVVTSRDSEVDELVSMNLGADDFVRKPYNSEILLLRIKALLKRSRPSDHEWTSFAHLEVSPDGLDVRRKDAHDDWLTLSSNEAKILTLLLRNLGRVVSRDDLMTRLWQSEAFIDDNTLSVNMNHLRRKLAQLDADHLVETVRGSGYRLREQ